MHIFGRVVVLIAFVGSAFAAPARKAPPAPSGVRNIGRVDVAVDADTVHVRVTSDDPELQRLATFAFETHGRFKCVSGDADYALRFSRVSVNAVRVDIYKRGATTPGFSQVVSGRDARAALLAAADVAVVKTNGKGLRGFFSAYLAFVGQGSGHTEIYTSDLFLGHARRLTNDGVPLLAPRWSPDGSRIVYTGYLNGFPDIYEVDLTSARRTRLANYSGLNSGARFSPNGQQIAMVLSSTGSSEIWIRSAAGGTPVRKTHIDLAKSSPCWSPDGSRIVFAMGDSVPQLYVMSAAGGTPQRLRTGYTFSADPDWNRIDPTKLACVVYDSGHYEIAVCDVATGQTKVVSAARFDAVEPCWLPDGRHLVYTARDVSSSVLCILDTESGRSTPITTNSGQIGPAMQASVWWR